MDDELQASVLTTLLFGAFLALAVVLDWHWIAIAVISSGFAYGLRDTWQQYRHLE